MFSNKVLLTFGLATCLIGIGFLSAVNLAQAQTAGTSVTILPAQNATVEASGLQETNSEEQGQVLGEKVYEETDDEVKLDQPIKENNQVLNSNQKTSENEKNDSCERCDFAVVLLLLVLLISLIWLLTGEHKHKGKKSKN